MATKTSVRAYDLATVLDRAPPGITTLSLDCFDTLLWRNTHGPRDVFAGIALPGGAMEPRSWAERNEQRIAYARTGAHETRLDAIYRRLLMNGREDEIAAAVEHELVLEASHLFPFAPAVALMREAKSRGLTIVIVSDMYLTADQLRRLLRECAGDEVLAMIDHIFMSCEHGVGKATGLFGHVLKGLRARPEQLLHIGDNKAADLDGAAAAGLHAVHLQQFDDEAANRLRLEMVANVMIDPAVRVTVPALQPHRAGVAMRRSDDIAHVLGHDVIGPAMHAFAEFIHEEAADLAARTGRRVRPVFLMRDGHLPSLVYDALYPGSGAVKAEISRLVATRATLTDDAALDRFVAENVHAMTPQSFVRHLMLQPAEYAAALRVPAGGDPAKPLLKLVRQGDIRRRIFRRARAFADRTIAHLRAAGVQDGDAVLLVDIGYNGSVQNVIAPMLEREMGLTVAGRYLFLREKFVSGLDKRGLLGVDLIETRAMHALATCVAVVEQMCNVEQGSTIDFEDDGTPVREAYVLNPGQHAVRERIQAAAVAFARDARAAMHRRPTSDDMTARRRMASAILARLLFLPLPREIALFESFDHDNNLGSASVERLLDPAEAQEGLRRRGLSYVNETGRMYVPAEIARHGLPLNISLMTTSRFGLDFRNADFQVGGIDVPVLMLDATEQAVVPITAYPTHDGWYRIAVPVARGGVTCAIQLGRLWSCVQLGDARWIAADHYDGAPGKYAPAATFPDGIRAIAGDVHACDDTGVLIAPACGRDAQVLTLLFRPLTPRDAAASIPQKVAA